MKRKYSYQAGEKTVYREYAENKSAAAIYPCSSQNIRTYALRKGES